MPDILRKTISATEMGSLLGVSPYATPWMLYQKFANGLNISPAEDERMTWGKLLEPLVLQQTAKAINIEIQPNRDAQGIQPYVRRGLLGATRDATAFDPQRGPGAVEGKCVFDYGVWMREWEGGKRPPTMHEIQLQMQMYVGDGETPYTWGIIPVFVCGSLKVDFLRKPMPELWEMFETKAAEFFEMVKAGKGPDPFGEGVEVPLLKKMFPPVSKKVRDYCEEPDAYRVAEDARMMNYHDDQATRNEIAKDAIKDRLRALLLDNEELWLPHGIIVRQKQHGKGIRITAYIPPDIPEGDISFFADTPLGG